MVCPAIYYFFFMFHVCLKRKYILLPLGIAFCKCAVIFINSVIIFLYHFLWVLCQSISQGGILKCPGIIVKLSILPSIRSIFVLCFRAVLLDMYAFKIVAFIFLLITKCPSSEEYLFSLSLFCLILLLPSQFSYYLHVTSFPIILFKIYAFESKTCL